MKKKTILLVFTAIILYVGGCISFKIEPLPEPEQLVQTFVLCKSVLTEGELLTPADITSDFVLDDPAVLRGRAQY